MNLVDGIITEENPTSLIFSQKLLAIQPLLTSNRRNIWFGRLLNRLGVQCRAFGKGVMWRHLSSLDDSARRSGSHDVNRYTGLMANSIMGSISRNTHRFTAAKKKNAT